MAYYYCKPFMTCRGVVVPLHGVYWHYHTQHLQATVLTCLAALIDAYLVTRRAAAGACSSGLSASQQAAAGSGQLGWWFSEVKAYHIGCFGAGAPCGVYIMYAGSVFFVVYWLMAILSTTPRLTLHIALDRAIECTCCCRCT